MQNFDDLDIEGRNPSHLSEEEREKEEHDRKRLMRSSVTAEDGTLRPVYSLTEDDDIWCHICNISLFGAHKLLSHNSCNRHNMKLDEYPYSVSLWSKRTDTSGNTETKSNSKMTIESSLPLTNSLAPGEPIPPGMEDQLTRSTTIQVSLDRHRTSPLVGLEYLLELIDNESCEPSYTCVLCDKRGDPRTVMSHISSYNHRLTYLNRHFPTVSRAIADLPRNGTVTRVAKNEISLLVAKKIEERFGRLQPQLVDKNQFEKNKMQYIKRVYEDYHFRETPELTFMEVYDVRWVTHFEEKMAEAAALAKKEDAQPRFSKIQHQYPFDDKPIPIIDDDDHSKRREVKKTEKEKLAKKMDSKEKEKPGMKIRILTKEKLNAIRKPEKSENKTQSPAVLVRPSDDTKSLSSLSSISSSPSPSRSRTRSRSRSRGRVRGHATGTSAGQSERSSSYRYRSSGRLRERDKWNKYREQISRSEETLERALKFHEKNPEKHPSYPDEWKKFWNRRYKELQAEGKDPSKHDFKPEWIEFWNTRMREIHAEQLQQRKEEIRKRLELPKDRPPANESKFKKTSRSDRNDKSEMRVERNEKWSPTSSVGQSRDKRERSLSPKRARHYVDSDDDVEYVGTTKTIKTTEYINRHDPLRECDDYGYTYTRGRAGIYRTPTYCPPTRVLPPPRARHYPTSYHKEKSQSPQEKEEVMREDLEIVGLLRLLTALEGQLGSLGPKIVSLLSRALAAEKAQPNSADDLLNDEEVSVLFETVKEKLKGQLFAGMIEKMAIAPTKSAIQNIAKLLHKASETKRKLEQLSKQQKLEEEERLTRSQMELTRPLIASFANSSRSIYQRATEASTLRSQPVSVPGVGTVDKVAIAQQIAAALIAQGRTNVSQDELETLINAVVGMAEASQHSDKPITAASFVKGLTAAAAAAQPVDTLEAATPIKIATTIATAAPDSSLIMNTAASTASSLATTETPRAASPERSLLKYRDDRESSAPRRDGSPRKRESPSHNREVSTNQRDIAGNKPETLVERPKSTRMESLSDNDLKTLLQNFKDLGTDEQHGLINFLKKLEATDPPRVEKLRGYVNLGTRSSHTNASKSVSPPRERSPSRVQSTKTGRSTSPFSTRKGNQNPTDDDTNWKPKLDMFADDEEELKQKQQQQQSIPQQPQQQKQQQQHENLKKSKGKVDLSDDDDDYSFEDIYKAADKNVNDNEEARRKKSRSRSRTSRSWSRSRSRSRSPSRNSPSSRFHDATGGNSNLKSDPNAILNETKRLIANIMGDLPNKYVVKSHAATKSDEVDTGNAIQSIPQLPIPQQNLYNANYPTGGGLQQQQQQAMTAPGPNSMAYQQMGNQQFGSYQQQQTGYNANSGAYMNNGYNYNQSYSNMMPSNQSQTYPGTGMQTNQYGMSSQQQQQPAQQQTIYGMGPPQYSGQNPGAPIAYPQQQYGNYPQQRFY